MCVFFPLFSHIFSATPFFFRFPPPPSSYLFLKKKYFSTQRPVWPLESRTVLVPQPAQEEKEVRKRYLKNENETTTAAAAAAVAAAAYVYVQLFNNVCFLLLCCRFFRFLISCRRRVTVAVQRHPLASSWKLCRFFIVLFIFLLCWIVRAGNGSRAGTVMMHVVMMSSASPWSGLRPVMAVVTVAAYVVHAVGSRSRIPTTRSRVNNGVVIAVGRVRAGRVHRWTGRYVAWFGHSIQRIPTTN